MAGRREPQHQQAQRGRNVQHQHHGQAARHGRSDARKIVDRCMARHRRKHGGRGVVTGSPTERLYRDIRALRIYEGATEVQQLVIARHVLDAYAHVETANA